MATATAKLVSAELAADVSANAADAPPRRWFYTQDGERYGPITGPELRAAAQLKFLGPADHVRCGDSGSWVQARDVRGLFDFHRPCTNARAHHSSRDTT